MKDSAPWNKVMLLGHMATIIF